MLVISVENSAPILSAGAGRNRTTKEDTFAHGFGLSNIRNVVQKYAGQCSVRAAEGRFTLKIVIPLPYSILYRQG